jgi:uncharacterized protein
MPTSYVVDGYNLLFQLGLLEQRQRAGALAQARRRLLDFIRAAFPAGNADVTVVFDSARGGGRQGRGKGPAASQEYEGLHIRYASGGDLADDVIERLIAQSPSPAHLVVISSDHRIQTAARRRGASPWSCDEFLDRTEAAARPPRPVSPDRPPPTRDEVRHWLEEFGDIDDDPEFRELFNPFPFHDVDEA